MSGQSGAVAAPTKPCWPHSLLAGVAFELGRRPVPTSRRRLQHEHVARLYATVVLPSHLVHLTIGALHPVAPASAGLAAGQAVGGR